MPYQHDMFNDLYDFNLDDLDPDLPSLLQPLYQQLQYDEGSIETIYERL